MSESPLAPLVLLSSPRRVASRAAASSTSSSSELRCWSCTLPPPFRSFTVATARCLLHHTRTGSLAFAAVAHGRSFFWATQVLVWPLSFCFSSTVSSASVN